MTIGRRSSRLRPGRRALALAVGVIALLVLRAVGWLDAADAVLVQMGFDPDRAVLIGALTAGGIAAGLAGAIGGPGVATLVGLAALAGLFGDTFLTETADAIGSRGTSTVFDPGAWILTVVTLTTVAAAIGWGAGVIGGAIRIGVGVALIATSSRIRVRGLRGLAEPRLAVVLLAGVLAAISLPTFADLINYSPDALFAGGSDRVPLAGPGAPSEPGSGQDGTPTVQAHPPAVGGALTSRRPWLNWRPSGTGTIENYVLPAPWTGGDATTTRVTIYLPPGYQTDSSRRYPVIYEAPTGFSSWERGAHFVQTLDGLIDGGAMPPTIVVFAAAQGSPYVDGECANSYDGREQLDTYYSSTLVSWTDANLRTMRSPDARTFLGYSEGGYCAAVLVMRHPSVFHQDISLSGYYQGGIVSNQTVNAWRPFDKNPALLATYSPDVLAGKIDAALRREMFVILSGTPTEVFYGPQLTNFGNELRALGFPVEVLDVTSYGHSWPGMRTVVPYALELLGEREAERGVFR